VNEYIEVAFRKPNGARLRAKRQTPLGIELDEPDPIERTVGIQLTGRSEATRFRMRRMAQVKGWEPGQFKLRVSVEDGNLILRGHDPDALPEGLYALRVQLEEAQTQQTTTSVTVNQDGHDALDVVVKLDDRSIDVDLTACDRQIERVLTTSTIDGVSGLDWVHSSDGRATRRACLLNLMATLRSRPSVSDILLDQVDHVFRAFNDRAYMKVDRALLARVEDLAKHPTKPFYREGRPTARIHERLLDHIPEPPEVKTRFQGLLSFRGEGKPSLQMVIAVPPVDLPHTYAEFDLDEGNPLQDLVGCVVHAGELLDGRPTNHLDMRKALAKTKAREFLYYAVV
jgi:plasmid stabilization system protein ParE